MPHKLRECFLACLKFRFLYLVLFLSNVVPFISRWGHAPYLKRLTFKTGIGQLELRGRIDEKRFKSFFVGFVGIWDWYASISWLMKGLRAWKTYWTIIKKDKIDETEIWKAFIVNYRKQIKSLLSESSSHPCGSLSEADLSISILIIREQLFAKPSPFGNRAPPCASCCPTVRCHMQSQL